ncbi:MAG: 5-formyltetrahydrofolate cyclo-ligase [Betaproteobacteria bacterium]|nr:5-formyltetrahydrofolate cyclo-ligase [Betaproteobacteria bacterium]
MNRADAVGTWRRAQRSALGAQRMAAPADQRRGWSRTITTLLQQAFPMLGQSSIGFYWPFRGEFDPRFAIFGWRRLGAQAALPVVVRKDAALEFRAWWPGVATARGVYDLPIPQDTAVVRPDALLIPPLGFDAQGFRLGYGGGYFDRTLAAMQPQPLKIGVAFELSRMPTIRPQAHDIAMDFIVTEAGVHAVGENGLALLPEASQASEWARALGLRRGLWR